MAENKTKYFMDTEFIEYPRTIQLISIGIVSQDGREYYAISSEYNYADASDWVKDNVIRPMFKEAVKGTQTLLLESNFHKQVGKLDSEIAKEILEFVGETTPEFFAYYNSYDWVNFCWLFGAMIDLPKNFPMYCRDILEIMLQFDVKKIPESENEHNALADAKWNRDQYAACEKEVKEKYNLDLK